MNLSSRFMVPGLIAVVASFSLLYTLTTTVSVAEAATETVNIEVELMPHGTSDPLEEYISLTNTGSLDADLSAYSLADSDGNEVLSSIGVLPAGATVTFCADIALTNAQYGVNCSVDYGPNVFNDGGDAIIISDGTQTLLSEAETEYSGSSNQQTKDYSFDYDIFVKPQITITNPNTDAVVSGTETFVADITRKDPSDLVRFRVYDSSGNRVVNASQTSVSDSTYEFEYDSTDDSDGDYTLKVEVENKDFELLTEASVPFTIENQSDSDDILDNLPDFDLPDGFFVPGLGDGGTDGDDEDSQNNGKKVTVCQATGNDGGYVEHEVNTNSIINPANGNSGINQNDIIPPFAHDGGVYAGQNWDSGQAMWENGCIADSNDTEVTYGCMDPEAINYDEDATESGDVSCEYPELPQLEIPERCSVVDQFTVPADSATGADSTVSLDDGRDYFAVVAGTYSFGNPKDGEERLADAEYSLDAGETEWAKEFADDRPDALDLFIDGANPDFGDYSSAHTYGTLFTGTGAPANFTIEDDPYSDNSGALDVTLYECTDELYTIDGYKYEVETSERTYSESEYLYESPVKSGWGIELYDSDGERVAATTTDNDGYFYFHVLAGDYEVREVMQDDWTQVGVQDGEDYIYPDGESHTCEFTLPTRYNYASQASDDSYGDNVPNSDYRCDFYNERTEEEPEEPEEPETPIEEEEEDDGTTYGTRTRQPRSAPEPEVLGAATSAPQCGRLLNDYMRTGTENTEQQVLLLQIFLNGQGINAPLTGTFDSETDAAVRTYQAQHEDEILTPWVETGLMSNSDPTGYVYKLTRWKINNTICPDSEDYPELN